MLPWERSEWRLDCRPSLYAPHGDNSSVGGGGSRLLVGLAEGVTHLLLDPPRARHEEECDDAADEQPSPDRNLGAVDGVPGDRTGGQDGFADQCEEKGTEVPLVVVVVVLLEADRVERRHHERQEDGPQGRHRREGHDPQVERDQDRDRTVGNRGLELDGGRQGHDQHRQDDEQVGPPGHVERVHLLPSFGLALVLPVSLPTSF